VDESSTNVAMVPRYARAPRGRRAFGKAPRNWGKNVTLISSITTKGMGPSMSIQGPSDTQSFGPYVREILAPRLRPGQIVLMDNLSVHKAGWVRDLIEQKGFQLWLLPSYSPDLKWDEKAEAGAPCGSYDGVMSVRSPRKEGHDHPAQRHRRCRSR
jgi:hypothetical protein